MNWLVIAKKDISLSRKIRGIILMVSIVDKIDKMSILSINSINSAIEIQHNRGLRVKEITMSRVVLGKTRENWKYLLCDNTSVAKQKCTDLPLVLQY